MVDGLRAGDEAAFAELMRLYGASMLRVAQLYVRSRAVAEEVVQEAWLAVFKGISRFEGRSSLKTWLFRILTNTAKTRAVREGPGQEQLGCLLRRRRNGHSVARASRASASAAAAT